MSQKLRPRHGNLYFTLRHVNHGTVGGDFDNFGDSADCEFHIDVRQASYREIDTNLFEGTEARHGNRQGIHARRQLRDTVRARVIRLYSSVSNQGRTGDFDCRIGDGCAGGIFHRSLHACRGLLLPKALDAMRARIVLPGGRRHIPLSGVCISFSLQKFGIHLYGSDSRSSGGPIAVRKCT